MKKLTLIAGAVLASTNAAFAGECGVDAFGQSLPCPTTTQSIPEISALEGTAALATLAAIVLIAWERSRRAV